MVGEFKLKLASFITFIIALSVGILSLIPNHLQASEEKPEAIVVPVAILGEVSKIRRKILQNTLNAAISSKFRIVPQARFEKAQEQVSTRFQMGRWVDGESVGRPTPPLA